MKLMTNSIFTRKIMFLMITLCLIFQASAVEAKRKGCQKGGDCQNGYGDFYYTDGIRNGDRYAGGFRNGDRHGEGTYHWWGAKKGQTMSAMWANDRPVKSIKVSYPDGSKYSGGWDMYSGRRGEGKYTLPDGSYWHAEWFNDEMTRFAVRYDSWGKVLVESYIHPTNSDTSHKFVSEDLKPLYSSKKIVKQGAEVSNEKNSYEPEQDNGKYSQTKPPSPFLNDEKTTSVNKIVAPCTSSSKLKKLRASLSSYAKNIDELVGEKRRLDTDLERFDSAFVNAIPSLADNLSEMASAGSQGRGLAGKQSQIINKREASRRVDYERDRFVLQNQILQLKISIDEQIRSYQRYSDGAEMHIETIMSERREQGCS